MLRHFQLNMHYAGLNALIFLWLLQTAGIMITFEDRTERLNSSQWLITIQSSNRLWRRSSCSSSWLRDGIELQSWSVVITLNDITCKPASTQWPGCSEVRIYKVPWSMQVYTLQTVLTYFCRAWTLTNSAGVKRTSNTLHAHALQWIHGYKNKRRLKPKSQSLMKSN